MKEIKLTKEQLQKIINHYRKEKKHAENERQRIINDGIKDAWMFLKKTHEKGRKYIVCEKEIEVLKENQLWKEN